MRFIHESMPVRVVFGAGSSTHLANEVARLGLQRVLALSTPRKHSLAERVVEALGDRAAGVYAHAVMHVPVASAEAACAEAARLECDGYVAIGGGSTIGLAKAMALASGLPIIAIPTTYSGSEMTSIWGLTADGEKRTGRDERVRPKVVIYDPELTLSLPPAVAGPSGINALAHCVEALYAADASPITKLMAEEGVRALSRSLPVVVREPENLEERTLALYGAWLAGAALGAATPGLHHKLCHMLGGSFNLPHAEVHTIILPHVAAYNAPAAPDALARVAQAMGVADAPAALFDLAVRLGAPTALRDIGMRSENLDHAADLALRSSYPNPAPLTRDGIRQLLDDAYHGRRPKGISV
jgi:alcohol dehydrogenase class IV